MNAIFNPDTGILIQGGDVHLSIAANHDEFNIPHSGLGEAVARMRLGWGRVAGHWQPVIMALAEAGAYRHAEGGSREYNEERRKA